MFLACVECSSCTCAFPWLFGSGGDRGVPTKEKNDTEAARYKMNFLRLQMAVFTCGTADNMIIPYDSGRAHGTMTMAEDHGPP